MKKVFSHESLVTINHLRNVLDAEGIATIVRNDRLLGVFGEVPFTETWPQLWVLDDRESDRASKLLSAAMADPPSTAAAWTCPQCGEQVEGQFAMCWNCGAAVPGHP